MSPVFKDIWSHEFGMHTDRKWVHMSNVPRKALVAEEHCATWDAQVSWKANLACVHRSKTDSCCETTIFKRGKSKKAWVGGKATLCGQFFGKTLYLLSVWTARQWETRTTIVLRYQHESLVAWCHMNSHFKAMSDCLCWLRLLRGVLRDIPKLALERSHSWHPGYVTKILRKHPADSFCSGLSSNPNFFCFVLPNCQK